MKIKNIAIGIVLVLILVLLQNTASAGIAEYNVNSVFNFDWYIDSWCPSSYCSEISITYESCKYANTRYGRDGQDKMDEFCQCLGHDYALDCGYGYNTNKDIIHHDLDIEQGPTCIFSPGRQEIVGISSDPGSYVANVRCYFGESDCRDGEDDDGDGLVDCYDPECAEDLWCIEDCYGVIDDEDKDGFSNCQDDDCDGKKAHATEEIYCEPFGEVTCNDEFDNDGNGLTDCDDSACSDLASCVEVPMSPILYTLTEEVHSTLADYMTKEGYWEYTVDSLWEYVGYESDVRDALVFKNLELSESAVLTFKSSFMLEGGEADNIYVYITDYSYDDDLGRYDLGHYPAYGRYCYDSESDCVLDNYFSSWEWPTAETGWQRFNYLLPEEYIGKNIEVQFMLVSDSTGSSDGGTQIKEIEIVKASAYSIAELQEIESRGQDSPEEPPASSCDSNAVDCSLPVCSGTHYNKDTMELDESASEFCYYIGGDGESSPVYLNVIANWGAFTENRLLIADGEAEWVSKEEVLSRSNFQRNLCISFNNHYTLDTWYVCENPSPDYFEGSDEWSSLTWPDPYNAGEKKVYAQPLNLAGIDQSQPYTIEIDFKVYELTFPKDWASNKIFGIGVIDSEALTRPSKYIPSCLNNLAPGVECKSIPPFAFTDHYNSNMQILGGLGVRGGSSGIDSLKFYGYGALPTTYAWLNGDSVSTLDIAEEVQTLVITVDPTCDDECTADNPAYSVALGGKSLLSIESAGNLISYSGVDTYDRLVTEYSHVYITGISNPDQIYVSRIEVTQDLAYCVFEDTQIQPTRYVSEYGFEDTKYSSLYCDALSLDIVAFPDDDHPCPFGVGSTPESIDGVFTGEAYCAYQFCSGVTLGGSYTLSDILALQGYAGISLYDEPFSSVNNVGDMLSNECYCFTSREDAILGVAPEKCAAPSGDWSRVEWTDTYSDASRFARIKPIVGIETIDTEKPYVIELIFHILERDDYFSIGVVDTEALDMDNHDPKRYVDCEPAKREWDPVNELWLGKTCIGMVNSDKIMGSLGVFAVSSSRLSLYGYNVNAGTQQYSWSFKSDMDVYNLGEVQRLVIEIDPTCGSNCAAANPANKLTLSKSGETWERTAVRLNDPDGLVTNYNNVYIMGMDATKVEVIAHAHQLGADPVCGNTFVELGEQCDDGNTGSGDGCSSTCQIEVAGCPEGETDCSGICRNLMLDETNCGGCGVLCEEGVAICDLGICEDVSFEVDSDGDGCIDQMEIAGGITKFYIGDIDAGQIAFAIDSFLRGMGC
jgi:cysteine-rich repeat protein